MNRFEVLDRQKDLDAAIAAWRACSLETAAGFSQSFEAWTKMLGAAAALKKAKQ